MEDNASPTASVLYDALKDAIGLFDQLKIPYALVGGLAAMIYGRARYTDDVDFVAAAAHQDALAASPAVMRQFHFDPKATWKLYHDSGVEIDIWKDAYSDAIASRAATIEFRGLAVRVAEVHDLVAMKLRANRPQDDYDISEIIRTGIIDESTLAGRIDPEELARFRAIKSRIA